MTGRPYRAINRCIAFSVNYYTLYQTASSLRTLCPSSSRIKCFPGSQPQQAARAVPCAQSQHHVHDCCR